MGVRVGDGTGMGGSVPTEQGLTANEDAKPESSGKTGAGSDGSGPELAKGQKRG